MYNLILTLSVYFFMTIASAVLLLVIIFRQEQWIREALLQQYKNYPVSIVHKDRKAECLAHLIQPVSLTAYGVLSAY